MNAPLSRCKVCDDERRVLAAPPGLRIPPEVAERSRLRVMRDPLVMPGRIYDVVCPACAAHLERPE